MKFLRAKLTRLLVDTFASDDRRIEHALSVLRTAESMLESYPGCDPEIVMASALLHDIGIKMSEEKHGYNNGVTQEQYGPPVAEGLLVSIGFPPDKIEIVKNIIGNHHSPSRYDYLELALLKKADQIVNRNEEGH